ncbi:MAG: glycosyltransferase [Gemmataceae bacterium]
MTLSAWVILLTYGLIVTFWKALHTLLFFYKPHRYFLSRKNKRRTSDDGPLVSILLAAKDEEGNIGDCIRSVLTSAYTHFELIVIDDRSQDRTADEVRQAAAGDPRVRLLQVRELPAGWTGKMNAVRQGLNAAKGDVILIMDADTRHNEATLGAALYQFERKKIGLLSLLPRFDHPHWFSKMVQPLVGTLVFLWKPLPWVNSRKRPRVAMGWGGFLMVRREVLERIGGLETVKDCFAADIALVRKVKQAGQRVRVLHGPELVATHMYDSLHDVIRGWTRLLRITADNSKPLLFGTLLALGPLCLLAYPMIALGLAALWRGTGHELSLLLGGMGLTHLFFQITLFGRFYRIGGTSPMYSLGHLPGVLFVGYLTWLAWRRAGTTQMSWRGTVYQLNHDGRAVTAKSA